MERSLTERWRPTEAEVGLCQNGDVRALLISTYEMGRQPFGLASPAAWLQREGIEVRCLDVAKEALAVDEIRAVDLVALHLPMHTATRLAAPVLQRIRELNPSARVCAYGLYAPLNADWLRSMGVTDVLGGEFEEELTTLARSVRSAKAEGRSAMVAAPLLASAAPLPRLRFLVPDRSSLPPLSRYATLHRGDGRRGLGGYTEASRGCRHLCRHCPVVPVYNGQFRIVQAEVVLADISAQVAVGAEHITFGDPDFFNGPTHALRIVEAMHARHHDLTYDVTIKVEHLLKHRDLLRSLRETGCLFVTTAAESLDDRVLRMLAKEHTRDDFFEAVAECRMRDLTLVPTFVAFHPWTTSASYCDMLDTIGTLGLVDHVAPIQLAIRLLIPAGSRLLELDEISRLVGPFDAGMLIYRWAHPDAGIDQLHQDVEALVGSHLTSDRHELFDAISALAHERAGTVCLDPRPVRDRSTVPYLNEPWYC